MRSASRARRAVATQILCSSGGRVNLTRAAPAVAGARGRSEVAEGAHTPAASEPLGLTGSVAARPAAYGPVPSCVPPLPSSPGPWPLRPPNLTASHVPSRDAPPSEVTVTLPLIKAGPLPLFGAHPLPS